MEFKHVVGFRSIFGVLVLLSNCCLVCHCVSYTDVENIFKKLTSKYTKELRPLFDQAMPVKVGIVPTLRSINSFDEVTGTLSVILIVTEMWIDEKLTWNQTEYNGFNSIVLPQTLIWKPELFLVNPAKELEPIGNEAFKVRITNDGVVYWYTGGDIKTSCSPDMTYFPFDIHTCQMLFAPWGYHYTEVKLYSATQDVDLGNVTGNGAWSLRKASFKTYNFYDMSVLEITFIIERKPLYFVLSLILPVLSLCIMNPMVFTLPYECGERVSFCITVLLSFAVFMTMTGETIPKVSEPMPLISIYLIIIQSYSGFITTMNGLILRAYNRKDDNSIPPFLWKVVCLCNTIMCFGCCRSEVKSRAKRSTVQPLDDTICEKRGIDSLVLEDYKEICEPIKEGQESEFLGSASWVTVGYTLDKVCFAVSYILLTTVSVTFLTIIGTRT